MVTLLYAGFDTLDIAFQGALPESVLEQLEAGREEAEKQQEKALVHIGPNKIEAHIESHGTRGGYRYILDTGPLGAKWMIKRNTDANQWNIFASPRATMLLALGYRATFDQLIEQFEAIGGRIIGHAINRADFAMDFQTDGFELHPDQVVAHSHAKVGVHWGKEIDPGSINQPATVFRGRRVESITIGKMPGRQIILYDKRREAIAKNKRHWFEVWGKDRDDRDLEVWRIEVRAGKKELKDKYRIATIDDFEAAIGDVIVKALSDIRYLADHQGDSNVTRQALHPIWQAAQETAETDLTELRSGLTPGQVREVERQKAIETYLAQCAGNAIGLGVSKGMSNKEIEVRLPELLATEIAQHFAAKGDDLFVAIKRSRERMIFLE